MTRSGRLSLAAPLDGPSCPAAEIAAATRRDEARAAMATVAALAERGVPVRETVVVARDLDPYEEPLFRAAIRYGVTPVFWTQLRVTRTRPYALLDALCAALDGGRVDPETLLRPLEHRWAPAGAEPPGATERTTGVGTAAGGSDAAAGEPGATADEPGAAPDESDAEPGGWPVEPSTVQAAVRSLPAESRPIAEWTDAVDDARVRRYVAWAAAHAGDDPRPETVGSVLGDAVEAYRAVELPRTNARDSPALLETETEARAVVRAETLVAQVERKYADRLSDGTLAASWETVRELCRLFATQRPGRREHSNATAVDVMEANDVWGLSVPYVIVVGLVDGDWPRATAGVVPPELQETVLTGDGRTGVVAPRTEWADGRDRDHFADAMRAATRGVVLTRHRRTTGGDERRPSPYLAAVDADAVTRAERERLTGVDPELPAPIAAMTPGTGDGDA